MNITGLDCRKTQKLSVDSRALAHCIKECAEKTMNGEQPDTNLLVGRMSKLFLVFPVEKKFHFKFV